MVFSAGANILGGYLGTSGSGKRSRTQKKNQSTIDDIMAGLKGEGPYASLYTMDEDAFQKSYVDPAKSMFKNQIAPQIAQSYGASGLERSTGMDDAMMRAGVDIDEMINAKYMEWMNNQQNRAAGGIDKILGADVGGTKYSSGERWNQAIGGYLTSPEFNKQISGEAYMDAAAKYQGRGMGGGAGRPGFSGGG